jgi:hypothetical protein
MTQSDAAKFPNPQGIQFVKDDIITLQTNQEIEDRLDQQLVGGFKFWHDEIVANNMQNRIRYENFIIGYLYCFDRIDVEHVNHSVYFRWDDNRVRIFLSRLVNTFVPRFEPALIGNSGADMTDPPPPTTPPPPLQ